MMFLKIAWKNVCGYKKRSIITVLLACITTGLLVFSTAFMDGSHNSMLRNALEVYPGYLQVTHGDFRDKPSYENLIFDVSTLRDVLDHNAGIATYGERFESFVLYAAGERSVGGMLTGVEPEAETKLSRLATSLHEGRYLDSDDKAVIYLGAELAKRLKVGVGDEISFIGNGADYSLAADLVTIKGTFRTGLFQFDSSAAFMNKKYLDLIMASEGMATHLVVLPEKPQRVEALEEDLNSELPDEYVAESWLRTMAALVQAMKMDSVFGYITLGVIFIVIFFVIMIYTLLSVHARVREVGVLRAVGTSPGEIFVMLILESVILSVIGVLLGGLIGGAFAYYFHVNPLYFSGYEEQFKQYGMVDAAIPAEFSPLTIVRDMLIMFALCILSTLYPILKLNKYRPIEAIHHV